MEEARLDLRKLSDKNKARVLQGFFKTNKGEYGYGDIFLGVVVPKIRKLSDKYLDLSFEELRDLINSKVHEERFLALLILIRRYNSSKEENKKEIFEFYLNNINGVNNWDLVDLSAPRILGNFLINKPKDIIYELSKSQDLWERRIAIISTYSFILQGEFEDTLNLSDILIKDKEDLIQKAVGWMLREVGKRNEEILKDFLKERYKKMPRTMLRYAIEKFSKDLRKKYLLGEI